jgi:hypothetical protein
VIAYQFDGQYHNIYSLKEYSGLYQVYNLEVDKISHLFCRGYYAHNEKGETLFEMRLLWVNKNRLFWSGKCRCRLT